MLFREIPLLIVMAVTLAGCAPGPVEEPFAGEEATTPADMRVTLTPNLRPGLRYRLEITTEWENHRSGPVRKAAGRRFVKVEVVEKSGAGYLMSWEYGPFLLTGSTRETVAEGSLRPDFLGAAEPLDGVQLVFFIDARGVPVELDNAPWVSAQLKKSDPGMAERVDSGTGMRIFDEPGIFYAMSGRIIAGGPAHKYSARWRGVEGVPAEGHLLLRDVTEDGAIVRVASRLHPDDAKMHQIHGREMRLRERAEHEFDLNAGRPRSVVYELIEMNGNSLGVVVRRKFRILPD